MKRITIQICIFLCLLGNVKATENFYEFLTEPASLGASGGVNYYTMIDGEVVPTPTSDLILQYLMGANGGNEASYTLDTSGNNYTGTVSGATWNQATNGITDLYGFDGVNDGIYNGNPFFDLSGTQNFSFSCWVKPTDATPASDEWLMGVGNSLTSPSAHDKELTVTTGGKYNFYVFDGAAKNATSTSDAVAGKWAHIVGTFDGTNIKIYVDGALEATTPATSTFNENPDWLYVGWGGGLTRYFDGEITLVEIHTNALTASEVLATNRTQAVELGVLPQYLTDHLDAWTNCVWAWTGNDMRTEGRSNSVISTVSAPTPLGTTSNGWFGFNGVANLLRSTFSDSISRQATFLGWFNPDDTDGQALNYVWSIGTWGATTHRLTLRLGGTYSTAGTATEAVGVLSQGADASTVSNTWTDARIGTWASVAFTMDKDATPQFHIYIDGVEQTMISDGNNTSTSASDEMSLGVRIGGFGEYDGNIDEIMLFPTVFTSNSIFEWHNESKAYLGH